MSLLRIFLIVTTVIIYAITIYAVLLQGFNWPIVFFGDLLNLSWRSQFNADFLIHLLLFAAWIVWREGYSLRGFLFAFLSIFMGGMFGFPYLLWATYKANGDPETFLLGVNADSK